MKQVTLTSCARPLALVLLTLVLAMTASVARAQDGTASLRGQVTDPSGAAVVGAEVQLTTPSGTVFTTRSGKDGSYLFRNLLAGTYSLKAQSKGFSAYEVEGLDIAPGQTQKADVALSILVQQENLNVTDQGATPGSLDV